MVGGGILSTIFALVVFGRFLRSCPSCNYWGVANRVKQEELGREMGTKKKTLTDTTKNRKGETIRTTEREIIVPVERIAYRNHMVCSHCHHNWTTDGTTEREL